MWSPDKQLVTTDYVNAGIETWSLRYKCCSPSELPVRHASLTLTLGLYKTVVSHIMMYVTNTQFRERLHH